MKMHIITVYDKVAQSYNSPNFVPTEVHAIRSFSTMVNDPTRGNHLSTHSKDFELYSMGTLDLDTGAVETHSPKLLATGAKLKQTQEN